MGLCFGKTVRSHEYLHSDDQTNLSILQSTPSVSLEDAIEPLIQLVPSMKTFVRLVREKCQNPADGLTPDQSAAIMLCTMRWQPIDQCFSFQLNQALRSNQSEELQSWLLFLKLLLNALLRLPTLQRRVYRAIPLDVHHQYPKNHMIIWWDLVLCANSLEMLQTDDQLNGKSSRTIFTLHSYSSKDISRHTYFSSKDLILLLPGTQFQVTGCVKDRRHVHWIDLKEIPSLCQSRLFTRRPSILKYPQTIQTSLPDQSPTNSSIQVRVPLLSNDDMRSIVQRAIREKKCSELWLYNVQMSSQAALILANALYNNRTLAKLYLNDNFIQDRGVYYLARALTMNNAALKELHLARNGITSKGAEYLADMLTTNQTLTTLSLCGNRIDNWGMKYFIHTLMNYNRTLENFYLSGNRKISDGIVDCLVDLFQQNQTLKKVHLFNCRFSPTGKEKLRNAVRTKISFALYL